MRFGVLGQLQVIGDDGAEVRIPQQRQRALLTVLLMHANQAISVSRLTELLWDTGPAVGPSTLRTHVWALRKLLGPAERLHTGEYHSYRLEVRPGELDADQFSQLARQGRRAFESGDLPGAVSLLSEALALWREPPLADVPATVAMGTIAQRLLDERLGVRELLNEARLRLGQHAELIPELQKSTADDPQNERLWEQLMLALHGAGRTAEALAAYQRARKSMKAELGLEPGHALQQLHRRILADDPDLRYHGTAVTAGGQRSERVIPRQLPAPAWPFIGREAELTELTSLLDHVGRRVAVPIVAIEGTAGVGKTALGVYWAHQVADRFPDGQLYADLRGFDPTGNPAAPAAAIRSLLDALEVPAGRIPASLDAQVSLYRSLLAGRRMSVLLDNARDPEQVRPLLPGSPGCLVVVTSRRHLAGLAAIEGARPLQLGLLTGAEAGVLLGERLGTARISAEPGAAADLIRLCARLPLALVIAAARVVARPGSRLSALVRELADAQSRLDALDTGDAPASVRAVFSWSAGSLSAPAARMFALLGLHPGPDITIPAAASLAGTPLAEAQKILEELAAANLTAETSPGRFSMHDLLRAYAAEQAGTSFGEGGAREAWGRILDHYVHTAVQAARLLNLQREEFTLPSLRHGVTPERLTSHHDALSWLEAEHDVLIAAVCLAEEAGFDSPSWQLPWALANFLDWSGRWDEWVGTQRAALAAVTRLNDAAAQAMTRRSLGQAYARLSDYEQARAHLAECPGLYRQLGDTDGEARAYLTLSWLSGEEGSYQSALRDVGQALALYRASGNRPARRRPSTTPATATSC